MVKSVNDNVIQHPRDETEEYQIVVQHVSQLNVLLTSEEINKTEAKEPGRVIGFGPAE